MKLAQTLALVALTTLAAPAMAGETLPYSQATFDRLTRAGKPVVLDISAPWCPTCKAQKPIVDSLMQRPAYKDVTLLAIDFDSAKPTLKKFKVSMQSTLVAFQGEKEVGRSTGDTTPQGIEQLFRKTLGEAPK